MKIRITLLLRDVDDSNYTYGSLRRPDVLSLRRLVDGQIQVRAETPGRWYGCMSKPLAAPS
jgi:hypothetical protein